MSGAQGGWEAPADSFAAMATPYETILLLGGNVGDPVVTLDRAVVLIGERAGTVVARSRDHWTEPWGFSDDRLFLNRAILLRTELAPTDLLHVLLSIEAELGRVRDASVRYAARTMDIDILWMEGPPLHLPELQIPHPRMHERAFALAPAADVAPDREHPILHRTVLHLLNDLLQKAR